MYEIYLITNQINEKVYVGQTKQALQERWRQHVSQAANGCEFLLGRAIRKYGSKFFTVSAIVSEIQSWKEANRLEMLWIKRLRSAEKSVGYNMTVGGEGVRDPTGEVNRRISSAQKKRLENPKNHPKYRHDIVDDDLLKMYSEGLSEREIARQIGLSYSFVFTRLRKAGLQVSKKPKPVAEDIRRLYEDEKHTLAEISSILKISPATAWRYLQNLGVSTSLVRMDKDADILRLYEKEGHTSAEVASILKISPSMVKKHLRRMGAKTRPRGSKPKSIAATEKVCPQCRQTLSLNSDNFRRNKSTPNGWSYWCKACAIQRGPEYRNTAKLKKQAATDLPRAA